MSAGTATAFGDGALVIERNMRRATRPIALALALIALLAAAAESQTRPATHDGCVTCHAKIAGRAPGAIADWEHDVHRTSGFSCVDCHGGDSTTDDKLLAKDPKRGYRGPLAGPAIIAVCAKCHSDAETMRRFAPRQRIDQASEYATSVHGKRLATGDAKVATCTSCHNAHGIRPVSDAKSPVYALNVAGTCARCHADSEHMKGYLLPDGSPLPTNQRSEYEKSAHFLALTKQNDLGAPTCNDCHGNHGAVPPGVGAIGNVCGTCHAVFAARFEASAHRDVFDRGCVECHSNHAVQKTSDQMLGTAEGSVCAGCHSEDVGQKTAGQMRALIEKLKADISRAGLLTAQIRNAGMEVSGQELALGEARTRLTSARTEIHTSDLSKVEPVVADGLKIVSGVDLAGQAALAELRFRRRGLAISLAAILLVIGALAAKIREIDRARKA